MIKYSIATLLLFIYTIIPDISYSKEKNTIAILNFSFQETSEDVAFNIKGITESIFVETKQFEVIHKNKIQKILEKNKISDQNCSKPECAAQIGKLLEADFAVIGHVTKNDAYVIKITYINVETGRILITDSEISEKEENFDTSINLLVNRSLNELSRRIEKYEQIKTSENTPAGNQKWYLGFGIGAGYPMIFPENDYFLKSSNLSTKLEFLLSAHFSIGGVINKYLHLGIDASVLAQMNSGIYKIGADEANFKVFRQITNTSLALKYFPLTKGLFLKFGAGANFYTQQLQGEKFKISKLPLGNSEFTNYTGALSAGLGYAFNVKNNFHILLHFDYNVMIYPSEPSERHGHIVNAFLSFYWF